MQNVKNSGQQTDKLLRPSGLLIKFKQPGELCEFGVARINLWNVNLLIKHARPGTLSRAAALLLIGLLCYICIYAHGESWWLIFRLQSPVRSFVFRTWHPHNRHSFSSWRQRRVQLQLFAAFTFSVSCTLLKTCANLSGTLRIARKTQRLSLS